MTLLIGQNHPTMEKGRHEPWNWVDFVYSTIQYYLSFVNCHPSMNYAINILISYYTQDLYEMVDDLLKY